MRLPNPDVAIISEEKALNYLLSSTHPQGRFKAAFFRKLGYDQSNWKMLANDLTTQHLSQEAEQVGVTPDGVKYRIQAPFKGRNGKRAQLVTIWIVEKVSARPRLVTAYPRGE